MPAHNPPMYLELSFDLGAVASQAAEGACWACGASALTFVDARDAAVNHPTKSGPPCEATSSPLDKTPYSAATPVNHPTKSRPTCQATSSPLDQTPSCV